MKLFKFFIPKEFPNPYTSKVIGRYWDFKNDTEANEFSRIFREHILAGLKPDDNYYKKIKATLDNFNILENFSKQGTLHTSLHRKCTIDYDHTVAYRNNGKRKTVVALGGGSWYKSVYENSGLDHISSWVFDDIDNNEFNIISFREQLERCYKNPVVYDSHYYNGFHDSHPDLESMATYIKSLFPDSEFYVIGDCKLGHSAALLSYYLSARKCFLHSAVTTTNEDDMTDILWKNEHGDYYIDLYQSISFEVLLRSLYFSKLIPAHLKTVQSIIELMPECDFCFLYHRDDTEFLVHSNLILESPNVKKYITSNKIYTLNDHNLVNFIRKFNIVNNFFLGNEFDIQ